MCVSLMFYLLDLSLTLTELARSSLCSSLCRLHAPYTDTCEIRPS